MFGYPNGTRAGVVYIVYVFSLNESRRNRMFLFADFNSLSSRAYCNDVIRNYFKILKSLRFTTRLARRCGVNFSFKTSAEHFDIIVF